MGSKQQATARTAESPAKALSRIGQTTRKSGNIALTAWPDAVRRTDEPSTPRFCNYLECKKRFIENYDEDKDRNFSEKAKRQFEGASEPVQRLFAHAIWLWGFSVNESKNCDLIYIENTKKPQYGFANSGQHHLTNKFGEVSFCIRLFDAILEKSIETVEEVKAYIEKICLCCAYGDKIEDYDTLRDIDIVNTYSTSVSMIHTAR